MKLMSTKRIRQRSLAGVLALTGLVWSTGAATAGKPDASADAGADGLVHCLLPGQVRRLGAFATSVTPRRAARLTPAQCQAGGGEYVEPQDHGAAVKMWLPMAAEGIPEAQTTVGELFDQRGDRAMAKSWYEKAAAQGDARSLIDLAGFLEQSALLAAAKGVSSLDSINRVSDLINKATGGLVAGLSIQRAERLRIDFVSPLGAAPVPHTTGAPAVYESPAGPLDVVVRVVGAAALKSVRVNGQMQKPDSQGLLNIPVTVSDARTTLLVQAEDESGQQAQAELTLLQRSAPLVTTAATATPAAASGAAPSITAVLDLAPPAAGVPGAKKATTPLLTGKRFALVIANQQYKRWPKLDTPRSDALAVASVLRQRFGFEVTTLQDTTRQQLLAALGRLRQQVGPLDQVVVYYAGHGQMDPVTARGYWIPVDGDEKDIAQWVSVIDVTDQLSAMTARHVLVIADSCYSGTLTRSLVPSIDQALTLEQRSGPLQQLSRQRARIAMTSGGLEPVVDGGSVEHSLFARSLLDVLAQVNSPVAAQELHSALSARFAHLARRLKVQQQPQYAPIGFAGHEAGDFVFSPI